MNRADAQWIFASLSNMLVIALPSYRRHPSTSFRNDPSGMIEGKVSLLLFFSFFLLQHIEKTHEQSFAALASSINSSVSL